MPFACHRVSCLGVLPVLRWEVCSTYIHLQHGCVHSGLLLFPRLPFRSLARQPVSGVSAKSSALRLALLLFCSPRRRTFCRHCVREVLLTKFNTYCAPFGVRFVAGCLPGCIKKRKQNLCCDILNCAIFMKSFCWASPAHPYETYNNNTGLQEKLCVCVRFPTTSMRIFVCSTPKWKKKGRKNITIRIGVLVQVRGPARSCCQPGVLFIFMFRLDQRPRKPKMSEPSPS